jgi:hypothetical protein
MTSRVSDERLAELLNMAGPLNDPRFVDTNAAFRELIELRKRVDAAFNIIGLNGCDCDGWRESDDDSPHECLAGQIEWALKGRATKEPT